MEKIQMPVPLVEMDGDEMTRIIWQEIKKELLEPFVALNTEYYDLGLPHRDATGDQVTVDAANAIKKYGVGVKCATITPNADRVKEYNLKEMYKSPNGTIRAMLDGTVFRAPILVKGIRPSVRTWEAPITIARHAFGDVYKDTEAKVPGNGKVELVVTDENGETRLPVYSYNENGGIALSMYNTCLLYTSPRRKSSERRWQAPWYWRPMCRRCAGYRPGLRLRPRASDRSRYGWPIQCGYRENHPGEGPRAIKFVPSYFLPFMILYTL